MAPPGQGSGDPTFDAASHEAPPPSLGYRAASAPPPPGSSPDLPPGFASAEEKEAARRKARRKSRVGAVVVGLILLAALGLTVLMMVFNDRTETLAGLDVGECFVGNPSDLDVVECSEAHDGELFARFEPEDPEGAFPEEELADDAVRQSCQDEFVDYFGAEVEVAIASGLDQRPFPPTEEDWDDGKTQIECVVVSQDGERFTGSVKDQGAEAEAQQE